jgi:hypothetical protein
MRRSVDIELITDLAERGVPLANIGNEVGMLPQNVWRVVKRLDVGRTWRRCADHGDISLRMTCLLSFPTWTQVVDYAESRGLRPARLVAIILETLCRSDRLHEVVGLKPLPPRMQASVELRSPVATMSMRAAI